MNETQQDESPDHDGSGPPPGNDFDPKRIRSVLDAERSGTDRMIAGVCAGLARHLSIDPVVLRVLFAVFTIIGGAGLIMYLACWIFLPADDADESLAAQWFNLDENEESVRIIGLVIAAVIAISSGTGVVSGTWETPFPWFGLFLVAGAIYLFFIRPRHTLRHHQERAGDEDPTGQRPIARQPSRKPRERRSPTLPLVTIFAAFIAVGGLALYANQHPDLSINLAGYVVTVLAVVGAGLIVSSWFGNRGPLIGIGAILAIVLVITSVLPGTGVGDMTYRPADSARVASEYELGIGQLNVDFRGVADTDALAGRSIDITNGVGETRVIVPEDMNVLVVASITLGEIRLFGRKNNGNDVTMRSRPDHPRAGFTTLYVHNTIGDIEVVRK